ncbi:MAG: hypothetical protein GY918_11920 [Gammaproteobacteria bacterium]|nr:hypothetical protein [Gammaproteobacteria bacterium]
MLTHDYAYYLLKVFIAGLPSLPGILTLLLFIGALISRAVFKSFKPELRTYTFYLCLLGSAVLATITFYSAILELDERPDTLEFTGLPDGEASCGSRWTNWIKSGHGTANPCPKGCYRGLTLQKEVTMSGFPPWPEYRVELQCWNNED